jgi:hypothetical protein
MKQKGAAMKQKSILTRAERQAILYEYLGKRNVLSPIPKAA